MAGAERWWVEEGVVAAAHHDTSPPGTRGGCDSSHDRFTAIQDRLRQLGATYYLLESLGIEGQFRFYCMMAVGGNSNYNRYFEASDRDALQAMERVLAEVELWRSGR